MPLALGDLRQLPFPDGTFTKAYALDVLEHLSPEALDAMLRRPHAFSRRAACCSSTRTCGRTRRWRSACAQSIGFARAAGDARPDRHDAGAAAQVGSPQPAARRAAPGTGRRHRGVPVAQIRYYTPLVGGFVENIMMRVTEHAMTKRAARKLPSGEGTRPAPPSKKHARRPRRASLAKVRSTGLCAD